MSTNITSISAAQAGEIAEQVLIRGDLAQLSHAERARYYTTICTSLGLNPMTKPFDFIVLNGKLTLYVLKACTDQLRAIYGVSVTALTAVDRDGLHVVTAHVQDRAGRADIGTGAVSVANLKGDALANALMKAETKAKRRATLSLCGLGFLDETELETIPEKAKQRPVAPRPPTVMPAPKTRLLEPPHDGDGVVIEDPADDEAGNEAREAFISSTRNIIRQARDYRGLGEWWNSPAQKKARRDFDLTKEEVASLVEFVKARIAVLKRNAEAAE